MGEASRVGHVLPELEPPLDLSGCGPPMEKVDGGGMMHPSSPYSRLC